MNSVNLSGLRVRRQHASAAIYLALFAGSALAGPIVADIHTVILDRFEQATVGSSNGPVGYVPGLAGLQDSAELVPGSFIQYSLPTSLEAEGTIEFWLNPNAFNVGLMNWNWNNTTSVPPAGHVLHLGLNSAGNVSASGWAFNPANMYVLDSAATLQLGQWAHVALSWSSSGARIYVNGILSASGNTAWQPAAPQFGYLNYWGATGAGLIDELHISSVQRTANEIQDHASTVPEPETFVLCAAGLALAAWQRRGAKR